MKLLIFLEVRKIHTKLQNINLWGLTENRCNTAVTALDVGVCVYLTKYKVMKKLSKILQTFTNGQLMALDVAIYGDQRHDKLREIIASILESRLE